MTKSKMAEEIAALREKAWTPEDARRVLGACAATGRTQAAFARESHRPGEAVSLRHAACVRPPNQLHLAPGR